MAVLDQIRATLSAVRRRSSSEQASDALDPQRAPEVAHQFPSEEMQAAAAPEGERHEGVHDPAERDRRAMHNLERASHARAPINAVIDPMSGEDAKRIESFVTGPDTETPSVGDLVTGSPDGGMESMVLGGSDGDSGDDSIAWDDPFDLTGGNG